MLLQGKWDHKTSNSYFYSQSQHIQNMHRDRFVFFFKGDPVFTKASCRTGHFFKISSNIALRNFCPFCLHSELLTNMSKLLYRQMEPFQSCQPSALSLATWPIWNPWLSIRLARTQPYQDGDWEDAHYSGYGASARLSWVSIKLGSLSLFIWGRGGIWRPWKCPDAARCSGGSLGRAAAQGAPTPAQGTRQVCSEEAGPRLNWEVNPLVRIRPREETQGQMEPADQSKRGSQGWDQARILADRAADSFCSIIVADVLRELGMYN